MTNQSTSRKEESVAASLNLDHSLSKEEINKFDLIEYKGVIQLINNDDDMLQCLKKLKKEKILGFDTETRPAFKKGVSYPPSLLQIAGKKDVYIFKITCINNLSDLFSILANPGIIKTGVAVHRDVEDLKKLSDFTPSNFVDLGDIARDCGMKHHGLRGLAAILLGRRVSKGSRLTNWSMPKLSQSALKYAATDAWIGRLLYKTMKEKSIPMVPTKFQKKKPKSQKRRNCRT